MVDRTGSRLKEYGARAHGLPETILDRVSKSSLVTYDSCFALTVGRLSSDTDSACRTFGDGIKVGLCFPVYFLTE